VKDAKKENLSCPLLNLLAVYFVCTEKVNYFPTIGLWWWWCMTYWSSLRSSDFGHRLISNEALGFRSQLYFSLEENENTEFGIPLKKRDILFYWTKSKSRLLL